MLTAPAESGEWGPAPPLPAWDFARGSVDARPFAQWLSSRIGLGDVSELATLHERVDGAAARACADDACRATTEREPRALLHEMVRSLALAHGAALDGLVVQYVGIVRILVPHDAQAPLPLHADTLLGHAPDERNLWIALTDARDSAALHALDLAPSLAVLQQRAGPFFDGAGCADVVAAARPRPVKAGDALLFTPLHVHGGVVNRTARTRVSVDVRIAPCARSGRLLRQGPVFVPLLSREVRR